MTERECPFCEGTGAEYAPGTRVGAPPELASCPHCHGTGVLVPEDVPDRTAVLEEPRAYDPLWWETPEVEVTDV